MVQSLLAIAVRSWQLSPVTDLKPEEGEYLALEDATKQCQGRCGFGN